MIFITGATGFIGNALIHELARWNRAIRLLLPPNQELVDFPKNIPFEIAVSNIADEKNLRASLKDVDTIIHLATDEHRGSHADLYNIDIQGTRALVNIAREKKVNQLVFVSHLGAEPSSAFPLLRAKGIAENMIAQSGLPYTILKTGPVYGRNDHFIERLVKFLRLIPFVSILPENGKTLTHPLFIGDLVAAITHVIDSGHFYNQVIKMGGPEYFTFREICEMLLRHQKKHKLFLPLPGNAIRSGLLLAELIWKNLPFSAFDLDYLAVDRTAPLDVLPRQFGIMPARLKNYIATL
ncbi:MAG: NAD(P)H-binding protein [Anaerolineae bacterium]|nr:NAD(P)H-binding protein [Anaerolineae bacterium]